MVPMNLSPQKTRYVTVTSNDHEVQTDKVVQNSQNIQVEL